MRTSFFNSKANYRSVILLLILVAVPTYANDSKKYEQSISEIAKKIKRTSEKLNANKALRASEREKLLSVEQELLTLTTSLSKIDHELQETEREYDALRLQVSALEAKQATNKQALRTLLIKRYKQGDGNYIKSLLNQENPYAVGRLNNYHGYFSAAFNQRLASLSEQAIEYAKLQETYGKSIYKLEQQRLESKKTLTELDKAKKKRSDSIAKLDKKIVSDAESIKALKGDRDRLRTLLAQLKKQAAEMRRLDELRAKQEAERIEKERLLNTQKAEKTKPVKPSKPVKRKLVKGGFLKQKGRLSYPVSGKRVRSFGSRMPQSGMRSEGTFFDTDGSVSVKTIFRGRVLFADFLKGFGLLIIVDHGDDHISLYGHNDRLLKKVGDVVDTGDVIAKTGVTGGLKSHGLYFEIRNNATPIDASKWCK